MTRRLAALVLLAGLVAGCGGDDPEPRTAATTPPTSASATATPAPSSAAPTGKATTPAPSSAVVLRPDGLDVEGRALRFGEATERTLQSVLAPQLRGSIRTSSVECGQGPRTAYAVDGFSVLVDGSTFVGWTEQGADDRDLRTADGLGLGSTLAEVRAALPDVEVSTGSLGVELVAGGLSGLLDGEDDDSRVTVLSGGETCAAR